MVARALWISEALRVVPWLRPCTRLRLVQGLRPRHNLARADQGSVKGIAYFYVGNGKGVAYFSKTHQANSNSL